MHFGFHFISSFYTLIYIIPPREITHNMIELVALQPNRIVYSIRVLVIRLIKAEKIFFSMFTINVRSCHLYRDETMQRTNNIEWRFVYA